MAQGKAWDKEEVIRTLEPIFKLGCDLKKACSYAGIPYTTVHTWYQADEELRIKIELWQNEPNLKVKKTIVNEINKGNVAVTQWYAERKMKDEFAARNEITGADGADFIPEKTDKDMADKALASFKNHATKEEGTDS